MEIFEDNDVSAYRGTRPEFERMVDMLTAGLLHAIVAWDQDRLVRQPRDLERLIELCDLHRMPRLVTAQGDLDLTSYEGQFKARIMVAVAKKSSDDTSRRTSRAAQDRRERGHRVGGKLPYATIAWVGDVQTPDPEAVFVIAEVATRLTEGHSFRSAIRWAHAHDPTCPSSSAGWKKLLQRTVHLDPVLQAGALAVLADPGRDVGGRVRRNWNAGLLRCWKCDASLGAKGQRNWQCADSHVWIDFKGTNFAMETALFERVQVEVKAEDLEPLGPPRDAALLERLKVVAAAYMRGELSREEWEVAREIVHAEARAQAVAWERHVLRGVRGAGRPPRDLAELWPGYSMEDRARVGRVMLEQVVVQPRPMGAPRVFDPKRLEFHWRL